LRRIPGELSRMTIGMDRRHRAGWATLLIGLVLMAAGCRPAIGASAPSTTEQSPQSASAPVAGSSASPAAPPASSAPAPAQPSQAKSAAKRYLSTGHADWAKGDYDGAEKNFRLAAQEAEKAGDVEMRTDAMTQLAQIEGKRGNVSGAIGQYKAA